MLTDEKNEPLIHWTQQVATTAPKDPSLADGLPDLQEEQGRTVHSMIHQAVSVFANALIKNTVQVYKEQKEREPILESRWKQVIPMHVESVVRTDPNFEFLLNAPKFPWSS